MSRVVLDAGALIALERSERRMWRRWEQLLRDRHGIITHAGILAQVWHDPVRQVALAKTVRSLQVHAIDEATARAAGVLMARANTSDVHDAVLALLCHPGDTLVTSDHDDFGRLLAARGLGSVQMISP